MESATEWFYSVDDAVEGPIHLEELVSRIRAKTIKKDSLIWNEEMPDWLAAGEVPDLVASFPKEQQTLVLEKTEAGKHYKILAFLRNNPGAFQLAALGSLLLILCFGALMLAGANHHPKPVEDSSPTDLSSTTATTEVLTPESMTTTETPDNDSSTSAEKDESEPAILVVHYPKESDFELDDIKFHIRLATQQNVSAEEQIITILMDVTNNSQGPFTLQQKQLFLADDQNSFYEFSHASFWNEKSINPGLTQFIGTQFKVPIHRRYFLAISGFKTKNIITLENIPNMPTIKPDKPSIIPADNTTLPKKLAPLKPLIPQKSDDNFPSNIPTLPSLPETEPAPTRQPDWNAYMQRVSQRMSRWQPPDIAMSTFVVVSMTIDRQGNLVNATIKVPSPSNEINQAALAIVNSPEPFPPLPPEYQGQTQTIDYRFDYTGSTHSYRRRH
jgi:TonB family protein